jgi:hypothetical protein
MWNKLQNHARDERFYFYSRGLLRYARKRKFDGVNDGLP